MKQYFLITFFGLITLFAIAQTPQDVAVDSTTDSIVVDQSALIDSLQLRMTELTAKIAAIDSTTSFKDFVAIKNDLSATVTAFNNATVGSPKPNTKEGVSWWTDFVLVLWENAWVLITTLITALFGFIKKDPAQAVGAVQKLLAKIKTRYIVVGASAIATIVGMVFFKEGAWTWPEAALSFVLSLLSGIGIAEVLDWFKIRLKVQKETPTA